MGMVVGLIGSGLVLSKKKPHVSKVLMWNVLVGGVSILGQIAYAFLYCKDTFSMAHVGQYVSATKFILVLRSMMPN